MKSDRPADMVEVFRRAHALAKLHRHPRLSYRETFRKMLRRARDDERVRQHHVARLLKPAIDPYGVAVAERALRQIEAEFIAQGLSVPERLSTPGLSGTRSPT